MDIIVTTPKSEMQNAAAEAEDARRHGGATRYFRRFRVGGLPNVTEGDRVYYVEDGYVRGFAIVCWGEDYSGGYRCDTTGREYAPGSYIFMRADSWKWIQPIPYQGFQGYRYASSRYENGDCHILGHPVLVVGDWLAPKPEVVR